MDIAKYEGHNQGKEDQPMSSIKCFKKMMIEAHSKTPVSVDACYKDFRDRKDLVTIQKISCWHNPLKIYVYWSNFDLISKTTIHESESGC